MPTTIFSNFDGADRLHIDAGYSSEKDCYRVDLWEQPTTELTIQLNRDQMEQLRDVINTTLDRYDDVGNGRE